MEHFVELSEKITKQLYQEILSGQYKNEKKLPPEADLALKYGVSRTLIRDCLSVLDREGVITRKHGVGSIINHYVLDAKNRFDLVQEFIEMVQNVGLKPEVAYSKAEKIDSDEDIAKRLQIECGEPVFQVEKIITANGKPVIDCLDYVAFKHVKSEDNDYIKLEESIFEFLEKYYQENIYMSLSDVYAYAADHRIAKIFQIAEGTPLLHLREVGYNLYGQPQLYGKVYYMNEILQLKVLRKKM